MLTHLAQWHPAWQRFHAPLVTFGVTLALALVARFLRSGLLAVAAGGLGLAAGWYSLTGRLWPVPAAHSVEQLGALAMISLVIVLLSDRLGSARWPWLGTMLAAAAAAWLLAGAPRHLAGVRAEWPIGLVAAVSALLFARLLAGGTPDLPRLALAGLTLAAGLQVAGAAPFWTQLALVPAAAALGLFGSLPIPGIAVLPLAIGTAALGCLVAMNLGRLARLGLGPADAAALSPLLAILLQPKAAARCQRLGRAATLAGCVLAGAVAVACVWLTRQALAR
jgi:hypothetical protein